MAATWSPFFWVQYGLYRMGLLNLSRLCLAFFSFSALAPALAADPPVPRGNVSVTVNPTTGYYSSTSGTVRLPSGVSASPTTGLPVVSKYPGGLQQSIPTGITIDAIKKSAPLPAVVRATNQTLKTGAKSLLRGGIAGLLLTAGLQKLLDSIDAITEDGQLVQKSPARITDPPAGAISSGASASCSDCIVVDKGERRGRPWYWACYPYYKGAPFIGYKSQGYDTASCYYLKGAAPDDGFTSTPLSESAINDAVDNNYDPEPDDWRLLSPRIQPDDVEITSAPTLSSNPKTTTIYDADGNPHEIQETNTWYDFDIRDNKSSQPGLDMKTRQETKTYKNGQLTGTTSTTSSDSAPAVGGGGGGGAAPKIDIPTDCEFMPTVCAFIDWVKKDDTPEDPDLSALIDDRDFTETYSISGGSKQCPADYEFTVDFIGRTYGLSFEPACDFASKMYYFLMAAAYIFAAYITVGVARNG